MLATVSPGLPGYSNLEKPNQAATATAIAAASIRLNAFATSIQRAREVVIERLAAVEKGKQSISRRRSCYDNTVDEDSRMTKFQADSQPPAHLDVKPRRSKDARMRPDLASRVFNSKDAATSESGDESGSDDQGRNGDHQNSSHHQIQQRLRMAEKEISASATSAHRGTTRRVMSCIESAGARNSGSSSRYGVIDAEDALADARPQRASMRSSVVFGGDTSGVAGARQHVGALLATVGDKQYQKSTYVQSPPQTRPCMRRRLRG